jgi:hypothetical protein
MMSATYRNILYGLALMGIISMIIMPDVVIGLLFELVHFFFELLFHLADISFEWIESTLDTVIEHLFHTDLHETQIIVFYLIAGIAAFPLYYLWRMLRSLFFRSKDAYHTAHAACLQYKARALNYWQHLSLINKVKFVALSAGIIYLASFLFM